MDVDILSEPDGIGTPAVASQRSACSNGHRGNLSGGCPSAHLRHHDKERRCSLHARSTSPCTARNIGLEAVLLTCVGIVFLFWRIELSFLERLLPSKSKKGLQPLPNLIQRRDLPAAATSTCWLHVSAPLMRDQLITYQAEDFSVQVFFALLRREQRSDWRFSRYVVVRSRHQRHDRDEISANTAP